MEELLSVGQLADRLTENIETVIKGKHQVVRNVVAAFLTGGHVLLEDVPGSGKTMLAKAMAASVGGVFKRIQMTPDLLPADITGINFYDRKEERFRFIPGPVFSNILIADEINRATPKTQSGLLECMEERQVTVDGTTYQLEAPFMVIATQNPVDTQGVFPLPDAQVDRFLMKLSMGYPDHESLKEIFAEHVDGKRAGDIKSVVTIEQVRRAMEQIADVEIGEAVRSYAADLIEATRKKEQVLLGVSPRGGIALLRMARTIAAWAGRAYVLPDDIQEIAIEVMAHRLVLKNSLRFRPGEAEELIRQTIDEVPAPTEDFR